MSKKKVRIELRYDPVADKDIIDFLDKYGSTRAGFIKSIINIYKNQIEEKSVAPELETKKIEETQRSEKNNKKEKKRPILGEAFSSKDFE